GSPMRSACSAWHTPVPEQVRELVRARVQELVRELVRAQRYHIQARASCLLALSRRRLPGSDRHERCAGVLCYELKRELIVASTPSPAALTPTRHLLAPPLLTVPPPRPCRQSKRRAQQPLRLLLPPHTRRSTRAPAVAPPRRHAPCC